MCLRWIAQHPPQGQRVLDYGCGSGILAIGAARFGAAPDRCGRHRPGGRAVDPGQRTGQRRCSQAGQPEQALGRYQMVLANILATPLKVLAPLLCSLVAPGGALVLAGILERQADELKRPTAPRPPRSDRQRRRLDPDDGRALTRQTRVRAGRGASARRSVLRTDSPGFARFRGPSHNSLRALRPLRSNRCDESVHEARKRAATKSSNPRRLATMRRGLPGHDFAETLLVFDGCTPTLLARGRRYPAGAHFCGGCVLGLGAGGLRASYTDSSQLSERSALQARSEFCDADPRPSIAAQSQRSCRAPQRPWLQSLAHEPDHPLPRLRDDVQSRAGPTQDFARLGSLRPLRRSIRRKLRTCRPRRLWRRRDESCRGLCPARAAHGEAVAPSQSRSLRPSVHSESSEGPGFRLGARLPIAGSRSAGAARNTRWTGRCEPAAPRTPGKADRGAGEPPPAHVRACADLQRAEPEPRLRRSFLCSPCPAQGILAPARGSRAAAGRCSPGRAAGIAIAVHDRDRLRRVRAGVAALAGAAVRPAELQLGRRARSSRLASTAPLSTSCAAMPTA